MPSPSIRRMACAERSERLCPLELAGALLDAYGLCLSHRAVLLHQGLSCAGSSRRSWKLRSRCPKLLNAPTDAPVTETVPSDRSWLVRASLFVGGFAIFGLILGLIIFPSRGENSFDPFTAICRSLGIPGYEKIPADPGAATASAPVSNVAWTVETNRLLSHASATKGAALAKDTCGACHGEDGKSTDATQFPNLAGQSQAAIFKELRDFHRATAPRTPWARLRRR